MDNRAIWWLVIDRLREALPLSIAYAVTRDQSIYPLTYNLDLADTSVNNRKEFSDSHLTIVTRKRTHRVKVYGRTKVKWESIWQ